MNSSNIINLTMEFKLNTIKSRNSSHEDGAAAAGRGEGGEGDANTLLFSSLSDLSNSSLSDFSCSKSLRDPS